MTAHTIFIIIRTISGCSAFLFGCLVLKPSLKNYKFDIFYYSLLLLIFSLAVVMVMDWNHLKLRGHITYSMLVLLGVYTFYRAHLAKLRVMRPGIIKVSNYINDIGFALVSLFVGFVIIGSIDLGVPRWIIIVMGILGILAGINAVTYKKGRLIDKLKRAAQ